MTGTRELPSGQVTFLFTDIEESTRLAQALGPGYYAVLCQHRDLLRTTLARHGAAEMFTQGDSYFFAFADAVPATTGCAAAQQALLRHDWPHPLARPRVRMGLHTGHAVPYGAEYASPEVHRAARVAAAAHGDQILLTAATAAAAGPAATRLHDLGWYQLRGFDQRDRLFQLVVPGLRVSFPRPRSEEAYGVAPPATHRALAARAA